MQQLITAIYDNVAEEIIGGLHLHPHAAPAIRLFSDIATMAGSKIALHPQDFDLIVLGTLNDDMTITGKKETLLTGAQWSAAQKPQLEQKTDAR